MLGNLVNGIRILFYSDDQKLNIECRKRKWKINGQCNFMRGEWDEALASEQDIDAQAVPSVVRRTLALSADG